MMIRKNPRGDFPVIHESAFVDPTAILCGMVVVEENVFIGPYAVIRADEVDDSGNMEQIRFCVPSTQRIGPTTDLATIARVSANAAEFSEDVARTNIELVRAYKAIQNEL